MLTKYRRVAIDTRIPMKNVIDYYCEMVGIPHEILIKKTRKRDVLKYRQMIAGWLNENSDVHGNKYFLESQWEIVDVLGYYNRSSLCHCSKIIENLCFSDVLYRIEYLQLSEQLNNFIMDDVTV